MKRANQRGFSLLELPIGAMLTVGLPGAIFALVNRLVMVSQQRLRRAIGKELLIV